MSKGTNAAKINLHSALGYRKFSNPVILLALILLLGIALRLYNLGVESYWIDEMSTVIEGQQSIEQLLTSGRFDQPPAYYLPFHFWIQIFGAHELSTRSFSALVGVGSIVLVYIIGRELFNESTGLLSALFMAVSEYQIYYSQVARFYSFFEMATLLSFLSFILVLRNKGLRYFAFYVLANLLLLYSHTYGIFVIAAQNIFIVLYVRKYGHMIVHWLISQVIILLAFIPYFYPLLFSEGSVEGTVHSNAGDLPLPSIVDILRSVYRFIFTARRERSWEEILASYAVAGVFLLVGFSLFTIWQKGRNLKIGAREVFAFSRERPGKLDETILVCCWLLGPIMLPFLLSFIVIPLFKDNYMISAAPAFYLLLAVGVLGIRKVMPLIVSLGMLAIMILPNLGYYYGADIHEQWSEAAAFVDKNDEPGDVIVFAPNMGIGIQEKAFYWYYQGSLQSCGLSNQLVDPVSISDALLECVAGHPHFWVIIPDYPEVGADDRFRSFFSSSEHMLLQKVMEEQFLGVSVYLFELMER
jgi:uncharacterized membrane protein